MSSPTGQEIFDQIRNPDYWRSLCPTLHIDDADFIDAVPLLPLSDETLCEAQEWLIDDGYFEFPNYAREFEAVKLARAVKAITDEGWMSPFGFIYDEFWLLFLRMHDYFSVILGPDYQRLPDFWIWHIQPEAGGFGWAPHREKGRCSLFEDGRPKSLTVWIALSDATPLNGCMYIVPASQDPVYNTPQESEPIIPQLARALPVRAGTALSWNGAVRHWGGVSSPRAKGPRISVAFEFQRGDIQPFNLPLTPPDLVPNFASRLRLLGKQILQYKHMYPLSPEMSEAAELMKVTEG